MSLQWADRVRGGMWGLLVGDALGVPYEFHRAETLPNVIEMTPPESFERAHRSTPPGTYSDDGAQALCLLASLAEHEGFDPDDFAQRLLNWYEHGYLAVDATVFDVGVQTSIALRALLNGVPALEAGPSNQTNNGNGSLMRVLPMAMFHHGTDDELARDADLQSRVTHGHVRSRVACSLYCLWARGFLQGRPEPWVDAVASVRSMAPDDSEEREVLEFHVRPDEPSEGRGGGYVIDSLRSARMIIERTTSYEEAVVQAIKLGDDTDTTAALVGGIAGIRQGDRAIPARWMAALRGRENAFNLIEWLAARH